MLVSAFCQILWQQEQITDKRQPRNHVFRILIERWRISNSILVSTRVYTSQQTEGHEMLVSLVFSWMYDEENCSIESYNQEFLPENNLRP